VVLAAHAALLHQVPVARLGEGAADRAPRIEVAFVQTLQPAEPPPVVAARAAGRPRDVRSLRALPVAPAASAPASTAIDLPLEAEAMLPAAPPLLAAAAPAALPASAALDPLAATPVVDWPPSTRLMYRVLGQFRGPAEGQAEVQWRRSGSRYEVEMRLAIGPGFAPLASRTVRSEGEIAPEGLVPQRYDEETRAVFTEPRRLAIELGEREIRLPSGQRVQRPPAVQDSASQFVQLTWMFTLDPTLLAPGRSLELPLALPRRVEPWTFDVIGPEVLSLEAGTVEAVHVKPRREARPGGDLTAEVWIAPTLQYLPVRILIRQSAETWLDLTLTTWPQQQAVVPSR
jgi:hypothetical protein